jgi:hypothetical protein
MLYKTAKLNCCRLDAYENIPLQVRKSSYHVDIPSVNVRRDDQIKISSGFLYDTGSHICKVSDFYGGDYEE